MKKSMKDSRKNIKSSAGTSREVSATGSMRRKEPDRFPLRMVALISQLGITMMVSLFMCAGIGYFISEKTGHVMWFLIFLLLGILSGFRSCYTIILRFVDLGHHEKKNTCQTNNEKGIIEDDEMVKRGQ